MVISNTYNTAEQLDKIAVAKSGTAKFSFDASGTDGLAPDGSTQDVTTNEVTGYSFLPANGTTSGSDSYQYDPLSRLTDDVQTTTGYK